MAMSPNMIGLTLPDVDVWSERVAVALGQNPSMFTGPGTNTYLVGTGKRRILLDTGSGVEAYLGVIETALKRVGCEIQEIVLTHGHPDHIGGVEQIRQRFGPVRCTKLMAEDERPPAVTPLEALSDGDVVRTEGATLRALHTPGHALDHVCYVLEEEGAIFSGDNVLGVGTTVIPDPNGGGDLLDYMNSLERLLGEAPGRIYPAHGPLIEDGRAKLRQYIDHRNARERQIVAGLEALGTAEVPAIVKHVYTDVPEVLHPAAAASVTSHLIKLEREGRAARDGDAAPREARWRLQ